MAEIIRMVYSVAGEIVESFAFDQLEPDFLHVGEGDVFRFAADVLSESVAVHEIVAGASEFPLRISGHGGNDDILRFRMRGKHHVLCLFRRLKRQFSIP